MYAARRAASVSVASCWAASPCRAAARPPRRTRPPAAIPVPEGGQADGSFSRSAARSYRWRPRKSRKGGVVPPRRAGQPQDQARRHVVGGGCAGAPRPPALHPPGVRRPSAASETSPYTQELTASPPGQVILGSGPDHGEGPADIGSARPHVRRSLRRPSHGDGWGWPPTSSREPPSSGLLAVRSRAANSARIPAWTRGAGVAARPSQDTQGSQWL